MEPAVPLAYVYKLQQTGEVAQGTTLDDYELILRSSTTTGDVQNAENRPKTGTLQEQRISCMLEGSDEGNSESRRINKQTELDCNDPEIPSLACTTSTSAATHAENHSKIPQLLSTVGDVNGHGNSGSHGSTNLGDVNIAPGGHNNSEKQRNAPILDANHHDYRPSAEKYHKCTVTENTGIDSGNGSGKQQKRTHKPRDAYWNNSGVTNNHCECKTTPKNNSFRVTHEHPNTQKQQKLPSQSKKPGSKTMTEANQMIPVTFLPNPTIEGSTLKISPTTNYRNNTEFVADGDKNGESGKRTEPTKVDKNSPFLGVGISSWNNTHGTLCIEKH